MKKMNVWILGHSTLLLEILYALLQEVALGAVLPDWGNVLLNAVQSVLAERFLDAIAKQMVRVKRQAKEIIVNRRDVRRARHRKS